MSLPAIRTCSQGLTMGNGGSVRNLETLPDGRTLLLQMALLRDQFELR